MNCSRGFASVVFLLAICLTSIASAEIKVKVVDAQDAAIAGAQVQLLKLGKAAPADVLRTSAEGVVIFRTQASQASKDYRIQVLAPGFAAEIVPVDPSSTAETITIKLRLATVAETVVVTATRTPVPTQAAGADVAILSGGQLEVMRPIEAADAVYAAHEHRCLDDLQIGIGRQRQQIL